MTLRTICVPWCLGLAMLLAGRSDAQWTVVDLHPAGATASHATAVRDGQQVGWATFAGEDRAVLWAGSAGSFVDLNPTGSTSSYARGTSGGTQVGASMQKASLWSGSAGSWVDLHPAGATMSHAYSMDGNQQAGYADVGGVRQASLWTGNAASWISLHPVGYSESSALGNRSGQQVGYAIFFGMRQAGVWSGSAGSRVSLHPAGSTDSAAYAAHNGRQVGYAVVLGQQRASIWAGNIGSWLSLHPAGATHSVAYTIDGDLQAGFAMVSGNNKASLWMGAPQSWVNLHQFLPAEFTTTSEINGLWQDGDTVYAVGSGWSNITNTPHALLWISEFVTGIFQPIRGIVTGGNQQSIEQSDDNYVTVRPGIVFSTAQAPVELRFDAFAPSASPSTLSFSVESGASFGNAQQSILLWNYLTSSYESLDTRLLTVFDGIVSVTVNTNPGRFIEPGTLSVRAAVTVRAVGPSFAYPWTVRFDKVWWNFPG